MDMSITLIVVIVLQVYAYVQIHQIVYIKYLQFFVYQLYLYKVVKKQQHRSIYEVKHFSIIKYFYLEVNYFEWCRTVGFQKKCAAA